MKLTGKQTWVFENRMFVNSSGTAVRYQRKKKDRLDSLFDKTYDEMHCNQKNWEMAERQADGGCGSVRVIKTTI